MPVYRLSKELLFPSPHLASPQGLLAVGGDLTTERLLLAYRSGIFPWFSEHDPILWWSPDPRMVLFPDNLKISKSLRKTIRSGKYSVTINQAFDQVIGHCASIRQLSGEGTWITPEMQAAYIRLHRLGYAHSFETWYETDLVGGLYGVSLCRCFFGESMFSRTPDASKVALVFLVEHAKQNHLKLIDCQVPSDHLSRMGGLEISRERFLSYLHLD